MSDIKNTIVFSVRTSLNDSGRDALITQVETLAKELGEAISQMKAGYYLSTRSGVSKHFTRQMIALYSERVELGKLPSQVKRLLADWVKKLIAQFSEVAIRLDSKDVSLDLLNSLLTTE